jgi:hypothetical protein
MDGLGSSLQWVNPGPRLAAKSGGGPIGLEHLSLSGWGYADIHAGVNFRFTAFSEVRIAPVRPPCTQVEYDSDNGSVQGGCSRPHYASLPRNPILRTW